MAGYDHTPSPWRRVTWVAAGLLVVGLAAWLAVLIAALSGAQDGDGPERDATGVPIVQQPTLAAVTDSPTPSPTASPTPSPQPTHIATPTLSVTPDATATAPDLSATGETPAPDEPGTESPGDAGGCIPPDGWEPYTVQQDDTLFAFALGVENAVTVDELVTANCLTSRYLLVGQQIFLPPGAAENAPPSVPAVPADLAGATGPRTPNCPCTIRVVEGWRREQIADAITQSETLFTGADFLAVTGPGASTPFDFTQERPAGTSLEGFLFPGVYTLQNETTAENFRDMLLEAFAANISPQVRADAAAQGISFYQALIMASVIQRETRGAEYQKLVASIFYNRLRDGNRLASTVPVQYALGGPGNWWPRITGSNMEVESPYNTYTRPGLPPAPVDNPGQSAILAAVYPAQTDYYYMAARCDGGGVAFSVTYEEHLAAITCD